MKSAVVVCIFGAVAVAAACGSDNTVNAGQAPGQQRTTDGTGPVGTVVVPEPPPTVTTTPGLGPEVAGPSSLVEPAAGPRAPFVDVGDAEEIRSLKEETRALIVLNTAILRLPQDAQERRAFASAVLGDLESGSMSVGVLRHSEDVERRSTLPDEPEDPSVLGTALRISGPTLLERTLWGLNEQMSEVLENPDFSGFADNDFVVDRWIGLTIDGDSAVASVVGTPRILTTPNPIVPSESAWANLAQVQLDLTLVRVDGLWRIDSVVEYQTSGNSGR